MPASDPADLAARMNALTGTTRIDPAAPLLEPKDGPLLAVRLSVLTRKTLGGLHTDVSGRVLRADGSVLDGVRAAGEAAELA